MGHWEQQQPRAGVLIDTADDYFLLIMLAVSFEIILQTATGNLKQCARAFVFSAEE